ncbi:MAG: DUF4038 domain-containing protein [Phycisphaerales bacterium]|nr:MAG: DUF4038 domain-containing protein [Phycisphaerales bacterium]
MNFRKSPIFTCLLFMLSVAAAAEAEPTHGPLRICRDNPRHFADKDGRALLLVGSHVWYNLVDMGPEDPPVAFDYEAYLKWMKGLGHNFMRMWAWEMVQWDTKANGAHARKDVTQFSVRPHPWLRSGEGKALDDKPKFDLTQFNPRYFDRLRQRVEAARENGIYVSIMLFEGWAMQRIENGWKMHPFHPQNNINGVNGDINGDGMGLEVHELAVPEVTEVQKTYIHKVVDTVNDLDNVLYEISNENHSESTQWQYAMIRYIHECERGKPVQHPVGMTFQFRGGKNQDLFDSPADWISPNPEGGYRDNPPANDGQKVILTDTDHLWGIGGNQSWVWKSFTRGLNPIFMDPYDGVVLGSAFDAKFEPLRRSMGYALEFAGRLDLNNCRPLNDLSTTGHCLANPGRQYLIYQPEGGAKLDVKLKEGKYSVEWFDPNAGKTVSKDQVSAEEQQTTFSNPVKGEAILLICASD